MTKTKRQTGRAVRNMLATERAIDTAERAGQWDAVYPLRQKMLAQGETANRLGVSWARILKVGLKSAPRF